MYLENLEIVVTALAKKKQMKRYMLAPYACCYTRTFFRGVNFWSRKCVKVALLLFRCYAVSPSVCVTLCGKFKTIIHKFTLLCTPFPMPTKDPVLTLKRTIGNNLGTNMDIFHIQLWVRDESDWNGSRPPRSIACEQRPQSKSASHPSRLSPFVRSFSAAASASLSNSKAF